MTKLPYGNSNFKSVATGGYYYVDRTSYIEQLEQFGDKIILFIRPRRFGKSLFVSMLNYYYGWEHKDNFEEIFGKYYIGKKVTPLANEYFVLKLDFSGIDTSKPESTYQDVLDNVRNSIVKFIGIYRAFFSLEEIKKFETIKSPQGMIKRLFTLVSLWGEGRKMYVLIDEYDHFTNELLSFDFSHFRRIVSRNGWVRKFYEAFKTAENEGIIERMFITGISPVTLDNLTSGFNIATNFTTELFLNEMMGFLEEEVIDVLKKIGVSKDKLDKTLADLRHWYDGYLFNVQGKHRIYNPDMVLYFAKHYLMHKTYPYDLLDENIASDYGKIRKMFQVNDTEKINLAVLKTIVEKGTVEATLTKRYSFEIPWTKDNFISLLFYLGILTIDSYDLNHIFRMPNYVIRQLYFQFFHQITLESAQLHPRVVDIQSKIKALAQQNDLQPIIDLTQNIIGQMAVEDRAHFNEISLKSIFTAFFYQVPYFNVFSELGVSKKNNERGRVDLVLMRRPPFAPKFQFAFELKYLRESQRSQFEKIKKEAIEQLEEYVKYDKTLKSLENLKAFVIVFLVNKGYVYPI